MKTDFLELYTVNNYIQGHNAQEKQFNLEVKNIVSYLSTYFADLKVNQLKRIRIDLNGDGDNTKVEAPSRDFPVCRVVFPYDYRSNFLQRTSHEKKREIVEMIKKSIQLTCRELDIDYTFFSQVLSRIEELNLQFVYQWNKSKSFRRSGTKVNIECQINPGFLNYFLIIHSVTGEPAHKKLVTLNTYYSIFRHYAAKSKILSDAKWESDDLYVVSGKKGDYERIRFEYHLSEDKLDIRFHLEEDVNATAFREEFELATTEDPELIQKILDNTDVNRWNVYV